MAYLERLEESAREGLAAAQKDSASIQAMPPPPARPAKLKPPAGTDNCACSQLPKQSTTHEANMQAERVFNSRLFLQQQHRLV